MRDALTVAKTGSRGRRARRRVESPQVQLLHGIEDDEAVALAWAIQASDAGDYVYLHDDDCPAMSDYELEAECACTVLALRCGAKA